MAKLRKSMEDPEVQMAPMIDMVFLLLVFFMTVSTMATGAKPEMVLAESSAARVPENTPLRTYVSLIPGEGGSSGRLFVGNVSVDEASLVESLKEARSQFPDSEVVLRVSEQAVWEDYGTLLSKVGEAGFGEMTLATYEAG